MSFNVNIVYLRALCVTGGNVYIIDFLELIYI